jgi:hypothetical protein
MNSRTSNVAGWIILTLMLCQFVPLCRVNQPSQSSGAVPLPVYRVLESRCGQCHSNDIRWPRSAFIAPLSWYVVHEVQKARQAFNYSEPSFASGNVGLRGKNMIRALVESGRASGHASIPGFEKPELTDAERKLLLEWSAVRD